MQIYIAELYSDTTLQLTIDVPFHIDGRHATALSAQHRRRLRTGRAWDSYYYLDRQLAVWSKLHCAGRISGHLPIAGHIEGDQAEVYIPGHVQFIVFLEGKYLGLPAGRRLRDIHVALAHLSRKLALGINQPDEDALVA